MSVLYGMVIAEVDLQLALDIQHLIMNVRCKIDNFHEACAVHSYRGLWVNEAMYTVKQCGTRSVIVSKLTFWGIHRTKLIYKFLYQFHFY